MRNIKQPVTLTVHTTDVEMHEAFADDMKNRKIIKIACKELMVCSTQTNGSKVVAELREVTMAQMPWKGEGLPPVGIDAEVLFDSSPQNYVGCKILAHDEERAVYRFTTGPRKGEYGSDLVYFTSGTKIPMFRVARTPEQIAAEEKGRAVTSMLNIVTSSTLKGCGVSAQLEALYDAGLRFEVKP